MHRSDRPRYGSMSSKRDTASLYLPAQMLYTPGWNPGVNARRPVNWATRLTAIAPMIVVNPV